MSSAPTVHVHVHLVMAGTFPLRTADLLFTDQRLLVPEYEYLTPFGLVRGRVESVSRTATECYENEHVEGLLDAAERTHRITYEDLRSVRLYDGGRIARPKVVIDVGQGPPYAYRIHAPVDLTALETALDSLGERRGFRVESLTGAGVHPVANVRRFLADR